MKSTKHLLPWAVIFCLSSATAMAEEKVDPSTLVTPEVLEQMIADEAAAASDLSSEESYVHRVHNNNVHPGRPGPGPGFRPGPPPGGGFRPVPPGRPGPFPPGRPVPPPFRPVPPPYRPVPPPVYPYPPRPVPVPPPAYRQVVCYAQDQWGSQYSESGFDSYFVQQRALGTCNLYSRGCFALGCTYY